MRCRTKSEARRRLAARRLRRRVARPRRRRSLRRPHRHVDDSRLRAARRRSATPDQRASLRTPRPERVSRAGRRVNQSRDGQATWITVGWASCRITSGYLPSLAEHSERSSAFLECRILGRSRARGAVRSPTDSRGPLSESLRSLERERCPLRRWVLGSRTVRSPGLHRCARVREGAR